MVAQKDLIERLKQYKDFLESRIEAEKKASIGEIPEGNGMVPGGTIPFPYPHLLHEKFKNKYLGIKRKLYELFPELK